MRTIPVLLATLAVAAVPARAGLQFSFNFTDVGTGFNDASLGASRRSALSDAASILGGYFPTYNVTLSLNVSSYSLNDLTLASAGSPVSTSVGFKRTVAQTKVLTGSDLNGSGADGTMQFNFFHPWDYDNSVAAGAYDFKSTSMHELMHALGFMSFVSSSGQGLLAHASGTTDVWTVFDQYLTDSTGHRLVKTDFTYDTSLGTTAINGTGGGVFFSGPNAMAAYGGRVPMYAPNPFASGSSLSHTDDFTFAGATALLMNAAVGTGAGQRTLSAVERGILMDVGYAVVPEPETVAWWLGVGLVVYTGVCHVRRARAANEPVPVPVRR